MEKKTHFLLISALFQKKKCNLLNYLLKDEDAKSGTGRNIMKDSEEFHPPTPANMHITKMLAWGECFHLLNGII